MEPEEFVEMAARMLTSRELEEEGSIGGDAEATLDSLIKEARSTATQAFAPEEGITAGRLFDELGDRIMSLDKGARVVVRSDAEDREIGLVRRIEFRDDAVSLCIDVLTRETP